MVKKFRQAVADLGEFFQSQGLEAKPDQVNNLLGDEARVQFIKRFREIQRLKIQLDQYTDLGDEELEELERTISTSDLRAYRGVYLETAQRIKDQQRKMESTGETPREQTEDLEFEYVLFASALIDYDYIMKLITKYSAQNPKKLTISRDQLIGLIRSDASFLEEREEITEYVRTLTAGEGLDESSIRSGYEQFKIAKGKEEISEIALIHSLDSEALESFIYTILQRMIFDGEQLTELLMPLDLGWRERRGRELALMADLIPILNKRAQGRNISGLDAYEHL